MRKRRGLWVVVVAPAFALALAPVGAAARAAVGADSPYAISARALLGPDGTDVYVSVSQVGGAVPAVLDKVQLKAWPLTPGEVETRNLFDVPSSGGVAVLHLDGLERGQRVEVAAHVKDGPQTNLETETLVRLRPDLVVQGVVVPGDLTRRHPFDVHVTVGETAGDTGATASVSLFDGVSELSTQAVSLVAGGRSDVVFTVALSHQGAHELGALISGAEPAESNTTNNDATVDVYAHRYLADGVVSSEDAAATQAGVEMLRAGGNAFDAAAAVFFALNVTDPHLAGIGGAANILVQLADGAGYAIDGRETAPQATTPTMYAGLTDVGLNGFSVGVPGALRAVDEMLQRWGTMSLAQTLQPAIGLAENGIRVGVFLAGDAATARVLKTTPELQAVFRPGGVPVHAGDLLVQPDLAKTFKLLAAQGESVFYRGEIADAIVAAQHWKTIPQGAGQMTLADLASYDVRVEQPLSLDYDGYQILGVPPSSCGGLVLLETLGLIDHFRANHPGYPWQFGRPETLHVMIDALRLAYADRDMWIGDNATDTVPVTGLLSPAYLEARSRLIKPGYPPAPGEPLPAIPGTPAAGNPFPLQTEPAAVEPDNAAPDAHTTHFSIIDQWGNAVAFTATVTDSFGSGILVPGYGFVLNDNGVNFNQKPTANPLTGNPGANDAAPGKRAMGNTAPTLIDRDGEPAIGTGSQGARFIPSTVLDVILDTLDFGMPIQAAVDAPRLWSQDAAGNAAVNPGLADAINAVRALGHTSAWSGGNLARATAPPPALGSTNSFAVGTDTITLSGAADTTRHPDATATVIARP